MEASGAYLLYFELIAEAYKFAHIQRYVNQNKFTPTLNLLKDIPTQKRKEQPAK